MKKYLAGFLAGLALLCTLAFATWPTVDVTTTNLDSDTDSPLAARPNLYDLAVKFNQVRAHVSTFMAGLLAAVDAPAARSALGLGTIATQNANAVSISGGTIATSATGTASAVYGTNDATGNGVFGDNTGTGYGVYGRNASTGYGVYGRNTSTGTGVYGDNISTGTGVYGRNTSTGYGVLGDNTGAGYGVYGYSASGIGVWASTLSVNGAFTVDSSGTLTGGTVPLARMQRGSDYSATAASYSVSVSLGTVTSGDRIFVTGMANGAFGTATVINWQVDWSGTFTGVAGVGRNNIPDASVKAGSSNFFKTISGIIQVTGGGTCTVRMTFTSTDGSPTYSATDIHAIVLRGT